MSVIPTKIIYLKNFYKVWPTIDFTPVNQWHQMERPRDLVSKIIKFINSEDFKNYTGD